MLHTFKYHIILLCACFVYINKNKIIGYDPRAGDREPKTSMYYIILYYHYIIMYVYDINLITLW